MRRPHLFWQLAVSYLAVAVLCTAALGIYAVRSARSFYLQHTEKELAARAALVEQQLGAGLAKWQPSDLEAFIRSLGTASDTRLTVIDPRGKVLADSEHDPATMVNHSDRPEVRAALAGGVGTAVRRSPTLGIEEMYVAVPIEQGGQVTGVVRAAVPLTSLNAALHALYWRIGLSAAAVALVAMAIGFVVSRRISRRMREIRGGAARFAAGDFSHAIEVGRTEEFAAVSESLNAMAAQLDRQIAAVSRESNEREAILTSMVEGVLAVDLDERVIIINRAAAELLGVEPEQAYHRSIQETVRNVDLQQLIATSLSTHETAEGEILLRVGQRDRYLQVHCAILHDAVGAGMGAIAVLNDVSRLKALESVRREFVANVSHEIKTPVTSIKGFAETLLDGAGNDPADLERFLRIIVGQADRLNSIVEDLLSLSSVEDAAGSGTVTLHEGSLSDVVQVAVDVCEPKASAKAIRLVADVPEGVYASVDPPLLEQAVVNLIDNAIKYSPPTTDVEVRLRGGAHEARVEVRDHGVGIAREHLPHLFERFYRVDKARSRDLGGTGLGLSIVKHIVEAHGGHVTVESRLGVGSTFTIHLPLHSVSAPSPAGDGAMTV
jgi:two-component system, OmpR family, phosphate regulon sensor histidine kinase PhoR